MQVRTILVPTDFSDHANQAMEWAIDLARVYSARIVALHSTWIDFPTTLSLSETRPDLWPPELREEVREQVHARFEQLQKLAAQSGVACETQLAKLRPERAILELARELPADLIVMGTRGRTGLELAFFGSVAERVTRLAPCPVMTVRAACAADPDA